MTKHRSTLPTPPQTNAPGTKAALYGRHERGRRFVRAAIGLVLVTALGAACGSRSKDELAPLPEECSELASKLGSCFHAPEMVERTKASFPTVKREDREGLERLRTTCSKNLADLKGDCRQ
jgi:hypothetical protein